MEVAPRLFGGEGGLRVYRLLLDDRAVGTQWTRWVGTLAGGAVVLAIASELDRAALFGGGAPRRSTGALVMAPGGAPIVYRTFARGAAYGFTFADGGVSVTRPDGSVEALVAGEGPVFLAAEHVPVFAALALAALGPPERSRRVARLHVDEATVAPWTVTPAGAGAFTTSHGETLVVGDDGALLRLERGRSGWAAALDPGAPEPPPWTTAAPAELAPEAPAYAPPPGARLEEVPGGVVSLPDGVPPFPGALFVHGSGGPDRHGIAGEIDAGSHEIMDGLARAGVLGLRCDTRAVRWQDRVDEADAQLAQLAARPEVRGVYLIGHSEGGGVALDVAARRPDAVRGVALLATSARPLREILVDQIRHFADRLGRAPARVAAQIAELDEFLDTIRAGVELTPGRVADALLVRARDRAWFADRLARTHADRLRGFRGRLLICQGERDFQVDPGDATRLADIARSAGIDVTVARFATLDHHFKPVAGAGSAADYHDRSRRVAPELTLAIARWIVAQEPG